MASPWVIVTGDFAPNGGQDRANLALAEHLARRGIKRAKNAIARTTEKIALSSARLVVANSERTRRDLVEHVGVDPAKIRVVYLGVDADKFRPLAPAERAATRADLGWDQRPR